jgi:hypothetical protein
MTGSIISTKITKTVTLGSAGYTSPLTISSSGTIDPMTGTAIGLYVPAGISNGTIVNNGEIFGAIAAPGGDGGIAVLLDGNAALTNGNIIEGGYGGNTGNKGHGLQGGTGILALAPDSITNTGLIIGGGGGGGYTAGGSGGTGVLIDGATLTNTTNGFTGIIGGAGGASFYDGGTGGIGVFLERGVVVNNAFIEGGAGGYDLAGNYPGYGIGGDGVYMGAGTLTNGSKGTIIGGTGGQGAKNAKYGGNGGAGVELYGGTVNNLGVITGGTGGAIVNTNIYGTGGGAGGDGLEAVNANDGLTVTNTGTITGGLGGYGNYRGGAGGAGVAVYNGAAVTNAGLIIGGAGATGGSFGGAGDYGVIVKNASFSNSGSVKGGAGGAGYDRKAEYAGTNGGGAYIGRSTLTNSGTITGGNGAIGAVAENSVLSNAGRIAGGYSGGQGMALGGASNAVNTGTIIGGVGAVQLYNGGGGGLGVYMFGGSTLTNSKLLAGGAGGYGDYYNGRLGYGGNGGTGVLINNAVLINAGTISGGTGGGGAYIGTLGDAVAFTGAGTLVVEKGAVFIGNVVADASSNDVLELAGTSSTALTGIGTQFTNFSDISFATGAAWTIEGNTLGLANGPEISGFAVGDTIVLDGYAYTSLEFTGPDLALFSTSLTAQIALGTSISGDMLIATDGSNSTLSVKTSISGGTIGAHQYDFVLQHGTASTISVMSGGALLADFGGKITSTTIEASGAAEVVSGGSMFHTVVDSKAIFEVVAGGNAISTTIKKGGQEYVLDGGTSSNTTIDGGTLELSGSGGVAGTLKFKGKGGVLEVNQTEIPTTVISGFKAGDKVELLDAASSLGTVTVTKANVVTISADGKTYKLNIAGAKVGETNFKFSGFALTETSKKMAIQRPAETPAGTAASHTLPELVAAGGYQCMAAAPAPHSQWTASAAAYAAPVHDLIQVRHGGIQTMVTLQSG